MDVIFFAVVFVYLDDLENALTHNLARAEPWVLCLVASNGDKTKCLDLGQSFLVPESTVAAVLVMLSLISIELFLLTFRLSLLTGWRDFFSRKINRKQEFVSLDALSPSSYTASPSTPATRKFGVAKGAIFEMQNHGYPADLKTLSPTTTSIASPSLDSYPSPPPLAFGGVTPDLRAAPSYFADALPPRPQHRSTGSASGIPRRSVSNSQQYQQRGSRTWSTHSRLASVGDPARTMGWDPTSTYASGGIREGEEGPGRAL